MVTYYSDFPDIDSVLALLAQDAPAGSGHESRKDRQTEEWDLSTGYAGAIAAYTGGWSEGAQKVYELAETIRPPRPLATRTAFHSSVAGAFPNVGAFLAGNPKSMYAVSKKTAQGRPFVHLAIPVGFAWSVNAEHAFNRGCALVALIDALETAGCRVKVTALIVTDRAPASAHFVARFGVKDYGDRLDVDQIIFTVAHPAFFRRIGFAIFERSEHAAVRAESTRGYGLFGMSDAADEIAIPDEPNVTTVRFPRLMPDAKGTPEKFLAEMVAVLPESLAVEIDGSNQ
jgi:hypothetical protein